MSKVVFITPNMNGRFGDDVQGTLLLATLLSNAGIDCEILPFYCIGKMTTLDDFLDRTMEKIEAHMPKIVSFYTRCDTYHIMLKMAERIKQRWPQMYIVLGGPQSDITADATVRQIPYVDYICCGEGETTIVPFFSSLLAGKPDTSVAGLVYRENGEVKKNPRPELLKDLDALPMVDYSFFHFDESTTRTAFPIDVGRGCPFGCTFCSTKSFWGRKFRLKSPERIVEEIRLLHQRFGSKTFAFSHDMFTLNRNAVLQTCQLLKELDFQVYWHCSARLDCIDPELLDIMTDAGLKSIYIGIETGSPRMQKLINKNLDLRNAVPIMSYLKEKGCNTTASFIYGFPEETEEDLSQTMALIAKLLALKSVTVQTHLCAFFAGTELASRYQSDMTKTAQPSDVTGNYFLDACSDLTDKHPDLFQHLLEYKTPLRTRLRYFPLFFQAWRQQQPVYQYLSEKYPQDRLIDMYYAFVDANKDLLDKMQDAPNSQLLKKLALADKFPRQFCNDENFDIIDDIYRLRLTQMLSRSNPGAEIKETFCFSPLELKTDKLLQEYTRRTTVVRIQDGKVSVED